MHALLPGNNSVQVIQTVGRQQQCTVGQQAAFFTVIELADVGRQVAKAGQFGVAVVQRCSAQGDAVGGNLPAQVGQQLIDAHDQRFVADQRAVGVVQRRGRQRETIRAGDLAALVVDHVKVFQQQLAGSGYLPVLVVQQTIAQVQADVSVAVQTAIVGLVQACDHGSQCHGAGDATCVAVIDLRCGQLKRAGARQIAAMLVVESAGAQHHAVTGDTPALAVVQAATGECQLCIADDLPALIDNCAVEVEHTCSGTGHAAIGIGQTGCFEVHGAIAAHHALIIVQRPVDVQAETALGIKTASAGIVQLPQIQLHALLPGNNPVQVVQTVSRQQQCTVGQ
ncbi:hypothetical protein ALQ16_204771 [Pseudomonas syringae pv. actinidiae]|nr:hypothetical protein ALQ16_204771 [Pseudomonas syringae pv. actinidiae]